MLVESNELKEFTIVSAHDMVKCLFLSAYDIESKITPIFPFYSCDFLFKSQIFPEFPWKFSTLNISGIVQAYVY